MTRATKKEPLPTATASEYLKAKNAPPLLVIPVTPPTRSILPDSFRLPLVLATLLYLVLRVVGDWDYVLAILASALTGVFLWLLIGEIKEAKK